jgi:hypothetical protein
MSIPVSNSRVDLSLLHPRFKRRLDIFFEDPRIRGRVVVTSACRSYAKQKYLYDKYKAGRGNLAANPDWNRPDGFFKGSFHMEQPDGFSYAVDFGMISSKIKKWEVNAIAKHYGIRPTVSSEWWHHQPRDGNGWFEIQGGRPEPEEVKVEPKMDWLGLVRLLNQLKNDVQTSPIKYRERSERVKILQRRLGAVGFDAGVPDGIFGRGTRRTVKRFQRVSRLKADGHVGPATWKALWE